MIQRFRFKQFSSVFLGKLKMGLDPVALTAVCSKAVVLLLLSHCLLLLQLFVVVLCLVKSAKIDLRLINFRQNLRDIRAFSWSTPTLVTLLQRL